MARTTLGRDVVEMIRVGSATKERILRELEAASSSGEKLRRGAPAITVQFAVVRQRDADALARGTAINPCFDEPTYDVKFEASLYALSDPSRADVLRFGRHDDQDIVLDDDRVSREHGLVIFADTLLYCDYGTLIDGVHAGSRNGTWVRVGVTGASKQIRNTMISWLPSQELMLGRGYYDEAGDRWPAIKITYRSAHRDGAN